MNSRRHWTNEYICSCFLVLFANFRLHFFVLFLYCICKYNGNGGRANGQHFQLQTNKKNCNYFSFSISILSVLCTMSGGSRGKVAVNCLKVFLIKLNSNGRDSDDSFRSFRDIFMLCGRNYSDSAL